jgi:hypothetical protein
MAEIDIALIERDRGERQEITDLSQQSQQDAQIGPDRENKSFEAWRFARNFGF